MSGPIMTVTSARVDPTREADLIAAYRAVLAGKRPDGLVASALMRTQDYQWQIATLWRDRAALDAMRAGPEPPAAPRVFRSAGAEPVLTVFEVVEATGDVS